jgi:hypothetical protein
MVQVLHHLPAKEYLVRAATRANPTIEAPATAREEATSLARTVQQLTRLRNRRGKRPERDRDESRQNHPQRSTHAQRR